MMNAKVVVIPVLAVLLSGCAAMRTACYIAARAAYDTPFYRTHVVANPGCRPSVVRSPVCSGGFRRAMGVVNGVGSVVSGVGSVIRGVGRIFGL